VVVASAGPAGQDRAGVFGSGSGLVAVVADGAGGTSGGGAARLPRDWLVQLRTDG